MTFRQTLLRGFLRKSLSSSLSAALALSSIAPSAWARRDEDYFNPNQYSYKPPQTFQNNYKPPKIEVQTPKLNVLQMPTGRLDTEGRGLLKAMNALNPKLPTLNQNSPTIKTDQLTLKPITLQFNLTAQVQTPKLLGESPNKVKDSAATMKTGFLGGIQKVFAAIRQAFSGAGQKVLNVIKAVVQVFRGKPNVEPSALVQKIGKDFSTLKEIRPGVLQTAPGAQTFVHGRVWEGGSTFQATDRGPRLIEGVTMEPNFGGLSREDGRTLPIRMRGTAEGIEAVGVDFARMTPGTSLKSSTPVEIPSVGTFQADKLVYTGQRNGDPLIELQGRGTLSVESITDMKVMKQAEQQLSLRLRLQNGSFEVKDAVLTVGGERTYLDDQGKGTSVNAIEQGVQSASVLAAPLLSDAKKLATRAEQNGRAINWLLKNLTDQTGNKPGADLQFTGEAGQFKDAAHAFSRQVGKVDSALKNEDYGAVLAALPGLQEQSAALQGMHAQVSEKVEALRGFSRALSGLTGDLRDLDGKIDWEGLVEQKDLRRDVLADRTARFFTQEKGNFATHTDKALASLIALTESGQVDPATAKGLGQTLITARNQIFGAMPVDQGAEKIAQAAIHPQETIGNGMDIVFFDRMNQLAETDPGTTRLVGEAGYWGLSVAGLAALGYSAWAAPVVTGGSFLVGMGTKKALKSLGANEDAAGFYAGLVALLAPFGLSRIPLARKTLPELADSFMEASKSVAGSHSPGHILNPFKSKTVIRDVEVRSFGKLVQKGDIDVAPTLERIQRGEIFPHKNDGAVFHNIPIRGKTTPELPIKPDGYYREYVHPTPNVPGVGPQRVVIGKGGEAYYTPDHYETFIELGKRSGQ